MAAKSVYLFLRFHPHMMSDASCDTVNYITLYFAVCEEKNAAAFKQMECLVCSSVSFPFAQLAS